MRAEHVLLLAGVGLALWTAYKSGLFTRQGLLRLPGALVIVAIIVGAIQIGFPAWLAILLGIGVAMVFMPTKQAVEPEENHPQVYTIKSGDTAPPP